MGVGGGGADRDRERDWSDLLRDILAWGIFTTLKIHQFVCVCFLSVSNSVSLVQTCCITESFFSFSFFLSFFSLSLSFSLSPSPVSIRLFKKLENHVRVSFGYHLQLKRLPIQSRQTTAVIWSGIRIFCLLLETV